MKFCQLIECKMRKIFVENHSQNVKEKLFPDPFLKNQNWVCLWSKVLYSLFFIIWGISKYCDIEILLQNNCFCFIQSFFKNKMRSATILLALFSAWFLQKIFLMLYFIHWPNFNVWLPLFCEILSNICIVIVC